MSHNFTVESGSSVRLLTAGKYCDRDIVVTATGGAEDLNAVLTEQEALIEELLSSLEGKAGGGGATIKTVSTKPSSNSTSISFTGLTAQPKMFAVIPTGNITLGSTRYVTGVMYDGSKTHGTYGYRSGSSATSYYSASYFTWTYSNGTLTVKTSSSTNGGNFTSSVTYRLVYVA